MHVVDDEALRLFQHAHINAIAYAYVRAVDSGSGKCRWLSIGEQVGAASAPLS